MTANCLILNVLKLGVFWADLIMDSINPLAHWDMNKMADILQTTLSNAFSSMKIYVFWFKFHQSLFLSV